MKQKYIRFIIVLVVLFQVFSPFVSQVNAQNNNLKKQPDVCAGPSETMQQYFQFQKDALSAIVLSDASNGNLPVSEGDGWLFTRNDLSLPSSALDHLVDNLRGRTSSIISTTATSVALLMLASSSVVESNVEGLAIFFKDRPIVRDYKQMLDIETEIFDTAFGFSKKVDLTRTLQGNTVNQFNAVVKQYQASGLLRPGAEAKSASMANILSDLISMNASMKFFISVGGEVGASELRSYAGCIGLYKGNECNVSNFVLGFSDDAVSKLKNEYSGSWGYGVCNSYASNFRNTLSKSARNNGDSIKSAWNDVKTSWDNLINALIGKGTRNKMLTDPCKMTDYERAQLDAYYGGSRTCGEGINVVSLLAQIKEYTNNKKILAGQREESYDLSKKSGSGEPPSLLNVMSQLNNQKRTEDRNLVWYRIYSGESRYNPQFSNSMNEEFTMIFNGIDEQIGDSQMAAMASDLSYELTKFKGLVNQINAAMEGASQLRKDLQDIADYQCSI